MTQAALSSPTARKLLPRLALAWALLPTSFLATAGSIDWWEAWAYCAIILIPMTVFVWRMLRADPEFLERRMTMRETEPAQRRVISAGVPVFLATLLLPGFDRRFAWSTISAGPVVLAEALVLAGYLGVLWVFMVNRWAGRTVETRPDQQVITNGPYALVRHPMYAATSVLYLATPIALGSWWGMIPAALCVVVLVFRIRNEEDVLVRDLPGYTTYRSRVVWRLLPGVW